MVNGVRVHMNDRHNSDGYLVQKKDYYRTNQFVIILIGLIFAGMVSIPVSGAEQITGNLTQVSPPLPVPDHSITFMVPQSISEGYDPNDWVLISSGPDLNITQFESDADQMVTNFREKNNEKIHRAIWVSPSFASGLKNNTITGVGVIIHPNGVVNQIIIYRDESDSDFQESVITQLNNWKDSEFQDIKTKIITHSIDLAQPSALGYVTGTKTSKPWGQTSWTSNYYYDFTSSKSLAYFYVDSTVIITPGKVFKDKEEEGWTDPTKDFSYTVKQDWNAKSGGSNPIPGLALRDHKPVALSQPVTGKVELGVPESLKITLDLNFPGERILDQTSESTPAWKHEFDPVSHNDVVIQSFTSDFGSEIVTYYNNLRCDTTYALATVTVNHKKGFTKGSIYTGWEYGPNDDNAYSTNAFNVKYTC